MAETTSMKEACSCCGSSAWVEAHFVNGSLICSPCARVGASIGCSRIEVRNHDMISAPTGDGAPGFRRRLMVANAGRSRSRARPSERELFAQPRKEF